jgi:hypothetical protein
MGKAKAKQRKNTHDTKHKINIQNTDKLINVYEYLPPKYNTLKRNNYKNYPKCKFPIPSQYMISGQTDSGKTQLLFNFCNKLNCFSKFIICAKNTEEPIYKYWIDCLRKTEKKCKLDEGEILKVYNTIGELSADWENNKPWANTLVNDKKQGIIIYDDQMCEEEQDRKIAIQHFTQFRKLHWTPVWLTQSHTSTHKEIRRNNTVLFVGRIQTRDELSFITRGFQGVNATLPQLQKYHADIMAEGPNNFMCIDTSSHLPEDQHLRFRKNLELTPRPLPTITEIEEHN